jgi:hypothetical protein
MSNISLSKAVRANLMSLQSTAAMMSTTQERLATGNKVNSALDNPTNFFTASALNSRASDMNSLLDSMASGIKTIEAANNGITSITKTVESMQSTLRQARQDKSFQTATYDVTNASVLTVNGGQYNAATDIKLGTQAAGVSASVTSAAGYGGASIDTTKEGPGARALVTLGTTAAGDKLIIDGKAVTLAAGAQTSATLKTALDTALGGAAETDKLYTLTQGNGTNGAAAGQIIIEAKVPTAAAPVVELGAGLIAATKGTTSFKFDAATVGTITAGGQTIANASSFDDFVANLKAGETNGGYTVSADATTKKITLTNTAYGATAPAVTGVPAYTANAITKFTVPAASATTDTVTIDGVVLTLDAGANATAPTVGAAIVAKVNADTTLSAKYLASRDVTTGEVTLTAKVAGGGQTAATVSSSLAEGVATFQDGDTGFTSVNGSAAGVHAETVAAATDDLSVTYGDKTADIKLNAIQKAGATATTAEVDKYRTDTVKSVNEQLKAKGLDMLEASFDATGKLSITSKDAEAKTLAISGTNASGIFGAATVNTGKAAVSGYNSTGTVDKFVEEINKSQAGKLRASNDNGKLRIENLSTQELTVSHDADGAGAGSPVTGTIAGNSVRDNLAKQFNELRDQLDKLSDDASFNGINLLRGDELTITFNENGSSTIKIQNKNASGNAVATTAQNLDITSLVGEDLDTDAGIDALLSKLSLGLNTLRSQASTFGSNLSSVQNRQDFTKNMINTLQTGAANLTLADTNEEAANLLALQTRQQLSSSALSMASQQDQAVLKLLQ